MKRILTFLLFFLLANKIYSQGIELYGGYFLRIPAKATTYKVQNYNNGQAGFNTNIYIRSVFIQFGLGYSSNNYTLKYLSPGLFNAKQSATVSHQYIYIPIIVYPKIYADGKNVVSVGGGVNFMVPLPSSKFNTQFTYVDGTRNVMETSGQYNVVVMPRLSIRYNRWLGKSFIFFTDMYSDITVMSPYEYSPKYTTPTYYSRATIGINAGIGYFLPINDGLKKPRYFEKRIKKTKE